MVAKESKSVQHTISWLERNGMVFECVEKFSGLSQGWSDEKGGAEDRAGVASAHDETGAAASAGGGIRASARDEKTRLSLLGASRS